MIRILSSLMVSCLISMVLVGQVPPPTAPGTGPQTEASGRPEEVHAPIKGRVPPPGEAPVTTPPAAAQASAPVDDPGLARLREAYKGPFILGSDLFNGESYFRQESASSVSDDYRLGPGDEMLLYVFGSATFELPLVVDLGGKVTIPKVGTLPVGGLRLADAKRLVQNLVGTIYSRARTELQFHKTRDVRIFILGEVYRPGSYVVPSLSSLLNALSGSGGPSPFGSYRAIQLIRDGRTVHVMDLYALRIQGKGMENILLRDGDTLFVPVAGTRILAEGSFLRVAMAPPNPDFPGVQVELKPDESAWEAIQHLGGLTSGAFPGLVTVTWTDSRGVEGVENLPMDSAALKARKMLTGDHLRALDQARRKEWVVEVGGYARVPGVFSYLPGMKLSSLLKDPDQFQPDTYMGRGQVIRTRPDGTTEMLTFDPAQARLGVEPQDLALQPRDRVELFQSGAMRLEKTVTVLGPFTRAGTFPWHEKMSASDLIFAAGVPNLNADHYYGELAHMNADGRTSEIVKLDLAALLYREDAKPSALGNPAIDPPLRPYDQITLYEVPGYRTHRTVTIQGQVKRPGPYVIAEKSFTLRQLIERAGGLTDEAMAKGGIFLRNSLREKDLTPNDLQKAGLRGEDPTARGVNDILNRLAETTRSGKTSALQTPPLLHGLADGSLNRLVVDFEAVIRSDSRRDVELQDGDQIIVPRKTQSAYVVGEVASPFANFRLQPGDKVKDIIKLAGGYTRNADTSKTRLLKADGRILDGSVSGQDVEPGDAILVPQRIRVESTWQENLQALTPLALILTAILR